MSLQVRPDLNEDDSNGDILPTLRLQEELISDMIFDAKP